MSSHMCSCAACTPFLRCLRSAAGIGDDFLPSQNKQYPWNSSSSSSFSSSSCFDKHAAGTDNSPCAEDALLSRLAYLCDNEDVNNQFFATPKFDSTRSSTLNSNSASQLGYPSTPCAALRRQEAAHPRVSRAENDNWRHNPLPTLESRREKHSQRQNYSHGHIDTNYFNQDLDVILPFSPETLSRDPSQLQTASNYHRPDMRLSPFNSGRASPPSICPSDESVLDQSISLESPTILVERISDQVVKRYMSKANIAFSGRKNYVNHY